MRGRVLTHRELLFRARLRRLRTMPVGELTQRLGERLRRELDRARLSRGEAGGADRLLERSAGVPHASFAAFVRETVAPRFPLAVDQVGRARLAHAFRDRFAERAAALYGEAERLAAHRVELLGLGEVALGPPETRIDWHRDPVTGRVWERRFWADYDLVRESEAGDPKRVHELNRHQHLPRLALVAWLTGEGRFAREAIAQIESWIEQNPRGVGVHWHSSLELALRALSWLWTLFALVPSPALDDETIERIARSLFAQLEQVRRYLSVYSSPNTHLLGEATALFVAGLLFAGSERATAWESTGRALLERELPRQSGEDGVHRELSPWYHAYALDFGLMAVAHARACGRPLSRAAEERVERMVEALVSLSRPDGTLPRIGDDDGGRALALGATSYDRVNDLFATGAALFARGDFKAAAGALRPETLWLVGNEGASRFDALVAIRPEALATHLEASGYFVHRAGWSGGDAHLVFDAGGFGDLGAGAGHGHADALAVTLAAGGRELLVDPGTYVYNGEPRWRDHFRSARAHNTATVDGREPATPGGTFAWLRRPRVRAFPAASFGDLELAGGEHDGFAIECGIVHRRRLLYARPDYWLVADRFEGEGEHLFELFFHLAPELEAAPLELSPGGRDLRVAARSRDGGDAGVALSFHAAAPLSARLVAGDEASPQGWVSRRYGERRAAPVIAVALRATAPATMLSTIAPLPSGVATRRPARAPSAGAPRFESGRGVALEIECGANLDLVLAGADGEDEVAADRVRARGELFWLRRRRDGAWRRLLAVEATRFEIDGQTLLDAPAPVSGLLTGPAPAAGTGEEETGEERERIHVRHRGHR